MTPYLQQLHFLPINYRSEYKINLFVYKSFIGQAPNYITNLLLPHINYSQRITRKENDKTWLDRYPIEKINYKCRSFRHIAPNSWNRLDINIRESPSIDIFKSRLKTFYFQEWLTLQREIQKSGQEIIISQYCSQLCPETCMWSTWGNRGGCLADNAPTLVSPFSFGSGLGQAVGQCTNISCSPSIWVRAWMMAWQRAPISC